MATDAEIAKWTQQLAEAEATLHKVMTGQVVNKIKVWDREVDTGAINLAQLRIYVNELRALLDLPARQPPRANARRIIFS